MQNFKDICNRHLFKHGLTSDELDISILISLNILFLTQVNKTCIFKNKKHCFLSTVIYFEVAIKEASFISIHIFPIAKYFLKLPCFTIQNLTPH